MAWKKSCWDHKPFQSKRIIETYLFTRCYKKWTQRHPSEIESPSFRDLGRYPTGKSEPSDDMPKYSDRFCLFEISATHSFCVCFEGIVSGRSQICEQRRHLPTAEFSRSRWSHGEEPLRPVCFKWFYRNTAEMSTVREFDSGTLELYQKSVNQNCERFDSNFIGSFLGFRNTPATWIDLAKPSLIFFKSELRFKAPNRGDTEIPNELVVA